MNTWAVQQNGNISESALDHVYTKSKKEITIVKLLNSSSDHVPIIYQVQNNIRKEIYSRKITKRSYKSFTEKAWNEELSMKNWSRIEAGNDLNEMVEILYKKLQVTFFS